MSWTQTNSSVASGSHATGPPSGRPGPGVCPARKGAPALRRPTSTVSSSRWFARCWTRSSIREPTPADSRPSRAGDRSTQEYRGRAAMARGRPPPGRRRWHGARQAGAVVPGPAGHTRAGRAGFRPAPQPWGRGLPGFERPGRGPGQPRHAPARPGPARQGPHPSAAPWPIHPPRRGGPRPGPVRPRRWAASHRPTGQRRSLHASTHRKFPTRLLLASVRCCGDVLVFLAWFSASRGSRRPVVCGWSDAPPSSGMPAQPAPAGLEALAEHPRAHHTTTERE